MRPLLFVNWRQVSSRFTLLMWLLACALAVVVLMHIPSANTPAAVASAGHPRVGVSPITSPATNLRH